MVFLFPWVTYAVWKTLLLPKAFPSTVSQDLSPQCCITWFGSYSSHLEPWKIGKIHEWAVTKPCLDQASTTCSSAKVAWPTQAIISEHCLEHPPRVPAWLTRSGAAVLLSGLEETSLCRTTRSFRDSMDFILGVNEWCRTPQSLPINNSTHCWCTKSTAQPSSTASQAEKVHSENQFLFFSACGIFRLGDLA